MLTLQEPDELEEPLARLVEPEPEVASHPEGVRGARSDGRHRQPAAAGLGVIQQLIARGEIARGESVVLFNTGRGYKYLEAWQAALAG